MFSDRVSIDSEESLGEWVFTTLTHATTYGDRLWPHGKERTKK